MLGQAAPRFGWGLCFWLLVSGCTEPGGDDDSSAGDDDSSTPAVTSSPGDDDDTVETPTPGDDDDATTGDDDDATTGDDDDATTGDDDDATSGDDDDATSGDDDDATVGDDDDATTGDDDDATVGDDDDTTADTPTPGDDDDSPEETPTPGDDDDTSTDTPDFPLTDCQATKRVFWAWDTSIMPPRSVEVPATCIFTGPGAYLYVADDQWGTNVSLEDAEEFMVTFEYQANPGVLEEDLGILHNNRAVFGELPDTLDNDPRMYVLLMDIKDYVNDEGETFSFDGYFNAYDELPDEQVRRQTFGLYRSNEIEMLYLNARIRPINDPYTLAVASHELQHLIQYNYDTGEDVWMGEALAEVAMLVNGWFTDRPWVQSYAARPYTPLVTNTAGGNYGAYLLWGMYLYEQLGREFMIPLESEQTDGYTGLNRALRDSGLELDFQTLFADWVVANVLQDPLLEEGQYGYLFADDLPAMATRALFTGNGGSYGGEVLAFGVDYFELSGLGSNRTLTVTPDDASAVLVRLVELGPDGTMVTTLRSSRGAFSTRLTGGADRDYFLVVSNIDTDQIDSDDGVGYEVGIE